MQKAILALAFSVCFLGVGNAAPTDEWVKRVTTSTYMSCADADNAPKDLPADIVWRMDVARKICADLQPEPTVQEAEALLGEKNLVLVRQGNHALILARQAGGAAPQVCCTFQAPPTRIAQTDLWYMRYRLVDLDHALINLIIPPAPGESTKESDFTYWRGPKAPPEPQMKKVQFRGSVTERRLWSEALQETRKLNIYLPPDYDKTKTYPALFMADGSRGEVEVLARKLELLIDAGKMRPMMIVGTDSGQQGIVEDRTALNIPDLRNADYIPAAKPANDRFERHMRFLSAELPMFATRELGASANPRERAVAGFSSGGVVALAAAYMHPETFGAAIAMSPSAEVLDGRVAAGSGKARFFLSAGYFEPSYYDNTKLDTERLRKRGYSVETEYFSAGHSLEPRNLVLMKRLPQLFPSKGR